MVIQAVDKKMNGVITRLEKGIAASLAHIANDIKQKSEASITERFSLVAGEVRMKLRKLEAKAGKI